MNEYVFPSFSVLDHGHVRLLDVMGSDRDIELAARQSFSSDKRDTEALIAKLFQHNHMGPFEQAILKFECRLPIFVARQWIRTRTASVNEFSMRYSKPENIRFYEPRARVDNIEPFEEFHAQCLKLYNKAVDDGVPLELARLFLPVSTYTTWIWTIDLRNLLSTMTMRTHKSAQWEIRQYFKAIAMMVKEKFPITFAEWQKRTGFQEPPWTNLVDPEVKPFANLVPGEDPCTFCRFSNYLTKRTDKEYYCLDGHVPNRSVEPSECEFFKCGCVTCTDRRNAQSLGPEPISFQEWSWSQRETNNAEV